jgi:hypothetical protein
VSESADAHSAAEELLKQLKVSDVLVGSLASLVQVGYAKLAEAETEQTHLAIEALRAVMPVLEGAVPEDTVRELRQATAGLQLAYAEKLKEAT